MQLPGNTRSLKCYPLKCQFYIKGSCCERREYRKRGYDIAFQGLHVAWIRIQFQALGATREGLECFDMFLYTPHSRQTIIISRYMLYIRKSGSDFIRRISVLKYLLLSFASNLQLNEWLYGILFSHQLSHQLVFITHSYMFTFMTINVFKEHYSHDIEAYANIKHCSCLCNGQFNQPALLCSLIW